MSIPPLDVNMFIIAALAVGALYGSLAGKFHLRLLILSIYVGLVLAEQLGGFVRPYLGSFSPEQVNWLLLGAPILLFSFAPRGHGSHDKGAFVFNIIVGLAAGALLVTAALHVMSTDQLQNITDSSFLASQFNQYYLWLLGLLPVAVIIQTFHRPKDKPHH